MKIVISIHVHFHRETKASLRGAYCTTRWPHPQFLIVFGSFLRGVPKLCLEQSCSTMDLNKAVPPWRLSLPSLHNSLYFLRKSDWVWQREYFQTLGLNWLVCTFFPKIRIEPAHLFFSRPKFKAILPAFAAGVRSARAHPLENAQFAHNSA